MARLDGMVAVITGGSLGLATAKTFVNEWAYVFITGRRQSELDKAKAAIGAECLDGAGRRARLGTIARPSTIRNGSWRSGIAQSTYSSQCRPGVAASRCALTSGKRCEETSRL